jgi:hypothetical protein
VPAFSSAGRSAPRYFAAFLLTTGLALGGCAKGSDTDAETQAEEASAAWLELVDEGDYGESWTEAAAYFKAAVTQETWTQSVAAVRQPLGRVESRRLRSKQFATTLPGAPEGEYVVLQYDTVFEHKSSAVETVTPMKGDDGNWRVSGYYVK